MATIGGSNIVTDGLVLSLDAANRRSYPGSGNTWFNLVDNTNNAQLNWSPPSPIFSSANGGTFTFNDMFKGARLGDNSTTINTPSGITVEAWFNKTTTSYNPNEVIIGGTTIPGIYIAIFPLNFGNLIVTSFSTSGLNGISTNFLLYNRYNHITLTGAGTSISQYLNGSITTSTTVSAIAIPTSLNPSSIGLGNTLSGDEGFFGNISSIKIYNRSLSASEVLQNYNAQKSRFGL